jgi:hypothetical protein
MSKTITTTENVDTVVMEHNKRADQLTKTVVSYHVCTCCGFVIPVSEYISHVISCREETNKASRDG